MSLGLLSWLIGLVENKPAKATCFLPDYCADLPPWRKPCLYTRQGRGAVRSRTWKEAERGCLTFGRWGWAHGRWCLKVANRKVSRDWHSEPHVKASQAACELALSCSIQGTSGGLVCSWLFPAASPPLPALCQTLNSECPLLFPSSFLEEAESGFSFCAEVRSNVKRFSLSCPFRFSCSE